MGGITEMAGGVAQMFMGLDEGSSEEHASVQQRDREYLAATTAIQSAQQKSAYEQGKLRILNSRTTADQKTAYANSGVDSTTGTAANTQANTAALGELDAQTSAINAAREVWGFKQAKKQAQQEYLSRAANINRKTTGNFLGGLSKFYEGGSKLGGGM